MTIALQRDLVDLLDAAGAQAGLDRTVWVRQPKGDEELALIPATQAPHLVVGEFCLALDALLRDHNRSLSVANQLRLRLALDEGPAELSPNGFAGRAVVAVSRLVNSAALRQALGVAEDAFLAVAVSHGVFRDWVDSGRSVVGPDLFHRVAVAEKEFVEDAWLWVPGIDTRHLTHVLARAALPVNLPPESAYFIGRDIDLARLLKSFDDDQGSDVVTVCVISGMAGVGKTALAVRAARRLAGRYPDGCVFLDLHGYSTQSSPLSPVEAADVLLRRLGVAGERIPESLEDRSALLRTRLQRRRLLLVLDNAADVRQVRPLLPAEPTSGVIITSRPRMIALDEAEHLELHSLSMPEGVRLFRTVAGRHRPETSTETDLVQEIVAHCGGLPLAIRIGAARLRVDATLQLGDLQVRLADEHSRLSELDDGERGVAASIAVSVDRLPAEHRRLFGLLGIHPDGGTDLPAAAALADAPLGRARRLLDGLVDLHLLERPREGRYRFHDLVAAFARNDATVTDDAAVHRLVDYYLTAADRADRAITPHRYRTDATLRYTPTVLPPLEDADVAMAWLTENESVLADMCVAAADPSLSRSSWTRRSA